MYFVNDQGVYLLISLHCFCSIFTCFILAHCIYNLGDGNWSEEHWNCGYNGGRSGFSGIPNSPPRDIWVASMAYLWLDEKHVDEFVCNDGLIIVLDDRLWYYSEQYDGWVLRDNVDLGIFIYRFCVQFVLYKVMIKKVLDLVQLCIPLEVNNVYGLMRKLVIIQHRLKIV